MWTVQLGNIHAQTYHINNIVERLPNLHLSARIGGGDVETAAKLSISIIFHSSGPAWNLTLSIRCRVVDRTTPPKWRPSQAGYWYWFLLLQTNKPLLSSLWLLINPNLINWRLMFCPQILPEKDLSEVVIITCDIISWICKGQEATKKLPIPMFLKHGIKHWNSGDFKTRFSGNPNIIQEGTKYGDNEKLWRFIKLC